MPDRHRKRLSGHASRGTGGPHAWVGQIVGGLIFGGIGTAMLLMAIGAIPIGDGKIGSAETVLKVAGGLFGGFGLLTLVCGVYSGLRRAARPTAMRVYAAEPWTADYAWDARGIADQAVGNIAKTFFFAVVWFGFLVPVTWLMVRHRTRMVWFLLIFYAAGLAVLGVGCYHLAQRLKYGASWLAYKRFPFFLGETLDVEFTNPRGIGVFSSMTVTLRFIEEVDEARGSRRDPRVETVCYQLYADTRQVDRPGEHNWAFGPMAFSFPLPRQADCRTELSRAMRRYWELQIQADTPGVDFDAAFLVPVYARPS